MRSRHIVVPPEHLYPPDEWRMVEARWSPQYADRAETVFTVSNGYLGVRGTHEEGYPAYAPGTYVNGFHETWPIAYAEEAYGLAKVGQSIVTVPDATVLELFVDDEPLYLPTARLEDYRRVLDMRAGSLSRDLTWSTASGKHVRVSSCRLVSFEHRHVLAVSYEVTVDRHAPVAIVSRVLNRMDGEHHDRGGPEPDQAAVPDPRRGRRFGHRVLDPRLATHDDGRMLFGYETVRSHMTLAVGVHHIIESEAAHRIETTVSADRGDAVLTVDAQPGVPIRVVKYVTYQTSRRAPPVDLAGRCQRTLDRVVAGGFGGLLDAQRANLDRFWDRADVVMVDRRQPVRVQQAVRWNIFQLVQASWRAEGASIPAKGLTSAVYDGHYFWDTELYVLPFLAYTQPRIARNLLRFRHGMLPKARERAAALELRGALFPWRTINGEESSASYQSGTAQFHLNAGIAYAVRHYVEVRGDVGLLAELGAEILVETARMWLDLGFYGGDGHFHIHGVTGPDEYTTVVNDNAFTNLMARLNLNYAATALRQLEAEAPDVHAALAFELRLGPGEIEDWERAAEAMHVPHDEGRGITPQDASFLDREVWDLDHTPAWRFPLLLHFHPLVIYRHQVLKQADVVMAMFLLGNEFTIEQKRRNFEYYDPLTTGDSSLSASIQSIVASELGDERRASQYFDYALLIDLADVGGGGADGVHIASAAGTWMALVNGFGGVRDRNAHLTVDPHLPSHVERLAFSLRFHDRQIRVALTHDTERYLLEEGDPFEITIRGVCHRLAPGEALDLPAPRPVPAPPGPDGTGSDLRLQLVAEA